MKLGHDRFHLTDEAHAIAAPGDGTILAAGSGSETIVWDVSGKVLARTSEPSFALAFEDASTLWMAMARVRRWRFHRGEPELVSDELSHPLAISPMARLFAAAHDPTESGDVGIRGLDGSSRSVGRIEGNGTRVSSLSFSHDGSRLAIGDEKRAHVVDLVGHMRFDAAAPQAGRSVIVAFVPHSDRLLVGRAVSKELFFVRPDGTVERTLTMPDFVEGVQFTHEGRHLAVTYDDGISIVDVATARIIATSSVHDDRSAVAFATLDRVAVCTRRVVRIFDLGRRRWDDAGPDHTDRVAALAISPDGTYVATSGRFDRTVHVWRSEGGTPMRTFLTPTGVATLSISPDGRRIVAGTFGGQICVLDAVTGEQHVAEAHENFNVGVAHMPDGTLVSAGCGRVVFRDPRFGTDQGTIATFPRGSTTDDVAISISGDARWLALIVEDRLTVYDMRTRVEVLRQSKTKLASLAPDAPHVAWVEEDSLVVAELPGSRELARWDVSVVSDILMIGEGRIAVVHFRGKVEILEIGAESAVTLSEEPPASSVAAAGALVAIGYEDGTASVSTLPPSAATAVAAAREGELSAVRALMRSAGLRTEAALYRDAPVDAGMDPDECGLRVVREGVELHVRGDSRDGQFVLEVVREGAPPPDETLMARVKGWFHSEDRAVTRRGRIEELPTPEELDAWLTRVAARWAAR